MDPQLTFADILPWKQAVLPVGHPAHGGGVVTFSFPRGGSPNDLAVVAYEVNGHGVATKAEPTPLVEFLRTTAKEHPVRPGQPFKVVVQSNAAVEIHVVMGLSDAPAEGPIA